MKNPQIRTTSPSPSRQLIRIIPSDIPFIFLHTPLSQYIINMKRLLKESVAQTVASSAPCFGPLNSGPPSFPSSALLANPSPAFHAVSGCLMFSTTDHLCRFLCGGFPWNLPPRGQLVLSPRWTSWKALRYLSTALRRGRSAHTWGHKAVAAPPEATRCHADCLPPNTRNPSFRVHLPSVSMHNIVLFFGPKLPDCPNEMPLSPTPFPHGRVTERRTKIYPH